MKKTVVILMLVLALAAAGCSDRGEELFETAKLEELQNSHEHAKELYREIISKYPDSKYAAMAKERLSELK
jgi:TolA-binding protein